MPIGVVDPLTYRESVKVIHNTRIANESPRGLPRGDSFSFMKIAICGSMKFAKEMLIVAGQLETMGHVCHLPEETEKYVANEKFLKKSSVGGRIGARRKIESDLIRKHWHKIQEGVKNYIGGNSFLEMGFAHILNKKIFLLNEAPDSGFIREEVLAMQPVILDNNLNLIKTTSRS